MKKKKSEILKNFKKSERGSITVFVLSTMLLVVGVIFIAYFSMMNKSSSQQAQLNKIQEEYNQSADAMEQAYNENIVTLADVTGYETENTTAQDSLGNQVVVPAGFKVVNPTDNVENGIVIEDVSHGATAGSQFVWIPTGTIHTSNGDITINLDRYTFASNGDETAQGTASIEGYFGDQCQELASSTYGNTTAKDIEEFKTSATSNGGYYLGRYEARTATERTAATDSLTQITVKPDEFVYNYVTQLQAASLSQGMYSDSNFESDLVNSYAWDTAIVFIQECSDQTNYANQTTLNSTLATTGTNNLDTQDVVCNIYDMASNCVEWTTETFSSAYGPCVMRGGVYGNDGFWTASRGRFSPSDSYDYDAIRPLLYVK